MSGLPQTITDAAIAAVDELPDPDSPFERDRWHIVRRVVLATVEPLIADAERERIRQLAQDYNAMYAVACLREDCRNATHYVHFADLLADPGTDGTEEG